MDIRLYPHDSFSVNQTCFTYARRSSVSAESSMTLQQGASCATADLEKNMDSARLGVSCMKLGRLMLISWRTRSASDSGPEPTLSEGEDRGSSIPGAQLLISISNLIIVLVLLMFKI